MVQDVGERLRAQGRRMTPQRQRVLDAVARLGHATPDDVVAPGRQRRRRRRWPPRRSTGPSRRWSPSASVGHTHLDHRAPSYHLADHADHIHLVCRGCGRVEQCDRETAAEGFAGNVLDRRALLLT